MVDPEFVEIYRAENGIEANLLKAALEEAGIPARVTDEAVATLVTNRWYAAPRLWVDKTNATRAAEVIRTLQATREKRQRSGKPG